MNDYEEFLKENNLTENQMKSKRLKICVNEAPIDGVCVKKSNIEGMGLFSNEKFSEGDLVAPTYDCGRWTLAGRYINHSREPNTKTILFCVGRYGVIASKNIVSGQEITADYRQVKVALET